jgi:methionyl-tRNA formyltransferase
MRLMICADTEVGTKVVRYVVEAGDSIDCLVVNAKAPADARARLLDGLPEGSVGRVLSSDDLSRPEVVEELRQRAPDLGILAWWPHIVRQPVLSIPRLGFLNFHPSLLPYNRGKNPNFWSLIEETTFGVTIHWVDDEVDHGDIAFQKRIDKGWEDTGESLYRKALTEIVRLFVDSYPDIRRGAIPRIPQDHGLATFHRASELDSASRLDLDSNHRVRDLLNRLRARTFPPHPACWFVDNDERYEVRISITKVENKYNG